jgi:hypothetical protein
VLIACRRLLESGWPGAVPAGTASAEARAIYAVSAQYRYGNSSGKITALNGILVIPIK